MNTNDFTNKLKLYICNQVSTMAKDTPIIGFIKPFIIRIFDKNINKVKSMIDLIADENGNLDICSLLDEIIDNVKTTQPFKMVLPIIGDVNIGNGCIKLNLPFTDKLIVISTEDMEIFKNSFI